MACDLTDTDSTAVELVKALLDHLARYRLTVFPALEQLPVFSKSGPALIKSVLRQCQRRSLISSAPLHQGARYWYLDAMGAQYCSGAEQQTGPLSEPAKLRAYAMLRFCYLTDRPRHRLVGDELARLSPDLVRPGLPQGYYFDPQGSGRLGLVRVDAGRRGRWDRVIQSIREDMNAHWRQPGFRRLIQAGRFEITVLTVFRQKARRIRESLAQDPAARCLPVEVLAMPELLPLVGVRP